MDRKQGHTCCGKAGMGLFFKCGSVIMICKGK